MEQLATQALELSPLGIAALALFVSLALLRKLNNGGKNGGNDKIYKLLEKMKDNDFHTMEGTIHELREKMDKLILSDQEQTIILKDIKNILQRK